MRDLWDTFRNDPGIVYECISEHIRLSYSAVLIGMLIAIPLGIFLTRHRKIGKNTLAVLGVLQTVPSMVMFGLLLPLSGIGETTAMIVLTLYSILPILRNTYTGISEVPGNYVEAATGMGMSSVQILFKVELPIALPVIVSGVRLSSVYIISWATIAAVIGGGGLGDLIYSGLSRYNYNVMLLGAIPASFLAVATSSAVGFAGKLVTPKGLKR